MTNTWLAFDIGTTGTKAALIGPDGRTLRSAYRSHHTLSAEGGVVEQLAEHWWEAVIEAAQELNATEAEAIALTGQMQDLILVNAQGEPTHPVILYSDTRARDEASEINSRIGTERLRQLTGNEQGASSLLAKLLWLSHHEPETLAHSAHLLVGAADFVALKLTGTPVVDTTTASTTGLLDINTRTWLGHDLLSTLGLERIYPQLPPVRPGGSLVGTLRPDRAAQLGLREGIPVYHGPGDAGATTLGVGSGEPGNVYAYLGTSGWVAFTSTRRADPETGVFTLAHPHPARYITVAPLLTAGGNLDWVRDLFGVDDLASLIDEALSREPTSLIYLPYLNGERSPFSDPLARAALIGLNARHTRADLCRAVLEGVVYAYRHALEALVEEPVAHLTLTGGGTRSRGWCQLFADITRIPVAIAEDAEHVGARGAVLAAQVASTHYADYAPPGFFPVATSLQPGETQRAHYERQYGLFRAAYPALKPVFAGLQ
jgi:xylulokinase